ncbi:MAG TPA: YbjN domain-containing protein [Polyangia bacterium]|nr:YbjN domain-containing protein [Polyangia bacterium]
MNAVDASCINIEKILGKSPAYRKVDDHLYVVKQGSSYVMISVVPSGHKSKVNERALVRVVAQVVAGVKPEPSLFRQLLILNGQLRFGSFAYVPEGSLIMFGHSILGGDSMDPKELIATVHDVALVADEYDDRIVARYGGARMQDVIEEKAMSHLFGDKPDEEI